MELDEDKVFGRLHRPVLVGSAGEVRACVASTMDVARRRAEQGVEDGYVVLAEHQTAGRGREGAWQCPPGMGVLLSVVLRPRLPQSEQKVVVLLGAVAATESARRLGVDAQIKWPNDVVVAAEEHDGLRVRKLGGVLAERVRAGDGPGAHVLGVGLNVNQGRAHLPARTAYQATSLRLEAGRTFDRNKVARMLLQELNCWYHRLRMGQPELILARWRRLSCLLRRHVRARVGGEELSGTVLGIRSSGELIFRQEDGRRRLLSDGRTELLL